MQNKIKLFFPDACWRPDLISGAAFLYFRREKIAFPLHPSVSAFTTGIDPFDFFRFAKARAPKWFSEFAIFGEFWNNYMLSLRKTSEMLEPLRGAAFSTIMFSYPRGDSAWEAAEDLIASSSLPFSEIAKLIDPYSAADELFSHIFSRSSLKYMRVIYRRMNCSHSLQNERSQRNSNLAKSIGIRSINMWTDYSARKS